MDTRKHLLKSIAVVFVVSLFTGCGSTGGSGSASVYYGTGFHNPYYYGGYYNRGDIIVTPPPVQPVPPPRPEQPIYRPPTTRPTPMPSIPSMPRPAGRR